MEFFPKLQRVGLELDGRPLPVEAALAERFLPRLRGLMMAAPLAPGRALLLVPCGGIHTLFMRGAIEAVFLSEGGRVLQVTPPLRPWRGAAACRGARAVLEWGVGGAAALGVREGAQLRWEKLGGAP